VARVGPAVPVRLTQVPASSPADRATPVQAPPSPRPHVPDVVTEPPRAFNPPEGAGLSAVMGQIGGSRVPAPW